MFSFLQQFVPKRRESVAVDDDYVDTAEAVAWVPPAPLVKAPPSDDEVAAAEREAEAAATRAEERRAEERRALEASLAEERRLAEERLAERERARLEAERRAEEARAAEEAREVERRERERAEREEAERAEAQARLEAERPAPPAPAAEPVVMEPVVMESVVAEPVEAEPVEAEPVEAEPVEAEPVVAEHVVAEHVEAEPVAIEPVEAEAPSYTWPATLLRHAVPMHYGDAARRNLLATVSHLSDDGLDLVLGDALYEEAADGLRPEVLAVLRASYHGEGMRATYERFGRIGSFREREIARDGLAALDRAADVARPSIPAET